MAGDRPLRILIVSPYLPSRRSGGAVRLRGLATRLSMKHAVSVLAYGTDEDCQDEDLADARAYCEEAGLVRDAATPIRGRAKRLLQLRSLLSPASFERHVYDRPAFQSALTARALRKPVDVVHVETCLMGHFAFPRESAVVLDEQNIEYALLRRVASVATGVRKAYSLLDHLKLRYEEQRLWRRVDACAVASANDEATVRAAVHPSVRTAVVPNAVDVEYFSPLVDAPDPDSLLFFGTLGYYPNLDGVTHFLDEVFPLITRRRPGARLVVVGGAAPPSLLRRAGPSVVFAGAVPDVRPLIGRAAVVIAPLRIGGGTRLKILEAMAMSRPVVSTAIGAEGIDLTAGKDIVIANQPEAFAAAVTGLLDDSTLGARIGAAGRRLIEERYDWTASADVLTGLYRAAIADRVVGRKDFARDRRGIERALKAN